MTSGVTKYTLCSNRPFPYYFNAFIQSNIATGIISAERPNTIRDSMIMGYKLLLNIPDAKNPDAKNPNAENPNAENPNAENPNAENLNA